MEGEAGVGVSPGPAHWNTGLPLTEPGRVTEQVRETDSPTVGEEVEGERKMIKGSVYGDKSQKLCINHCDNGWWVCGYL